MSMSIFASRKPEVSYIKAVRWSDTNNFTTVYIAAMQSILSRPDAGLFNPDEIADRAYRQAEAMLRRVP